jgi:hypothetical protein
MRKNWPYFIVASFLNAVLITGAFIEFKLRGMADSPQPTWYEINPFVFTGGTFIISFLVIMTIVGLLDLRYKLQASGKTRETSNVKREIRNPLQPVTWNL